MKVHVRGISGQETTEIEVGDKAALAYLVTLICWSFGLHPEHTTACVLHGEVVLTDP